MRLCAGALLCGLCSASEVTCRINQSDMGKVLWVVADNTLRLPIRFLRQETEVIAQREQPLKEAARVIEPPKEHETVDKPEAARKKNPLAACQTIFRSLRVIAAHQPVDDQMAFNCLDCAKQAFVARRQKSG